VGRRDGPRRRPGDGAVLQRLGARLRATPSRAHSGHRPGDDRPRVRARSAAAGVVGITAFAALVTPVPGRRASAGGVPATP
jgi:hypothetical protein